MTTNPTNNVLKTQLEAVTNSKIEADDRIRDLEGQVMQLSAELAAARAETVQSVMHVADWLAQQQFGRKIYGPTPAIAETSAEPELIRHRTQARHLCNQLEDEFNQRMAEVA